MLSIHDQQRIEKALSEAEAARLAVAELNARFHSLQGQLEALRERLDKAAPQREAPKIKIPPFPKALRELGLRPPKHEPEDGAA